MYYVNKMLCADYIAGEEQLNYLQAFILLKYLWDLLTSLNIYQADEHFSRLDSFPLLNTKQNIKITWH